MTKKHSSDRVGSPAMTISGAISTRQFNLKKMHIRAALLGALMVTLWMPKAKAQNCAPLTIASLSNYLPAGTGFAFDDENFVPMASANVWFEVTDPATGSLTGAYGGYAVSGTVSQVGTSGLSVSFTYSTGPSQWYSYTGAIAIADQSCDIFIAGTYTVNFSVFRPGRPPIILHLTAGPYPFSGKRASEFN